MGKGAASGKRAIRAAVVNATPAEAPESMDEQSGADGQSGGSRFRKSRNGWFRNCADDKWVYVSGPFDVLSETRDDEAQAWGLLIRFDDRDRNEQRINLTRDLFASDTAELRNLLARRGLYLNPSKEARTFLIELLSEMSSRKRVRVVSRTGWHRVDGRRVFVLPRETFGKLPVEILYEPELRESAVFEAAGSARDWRESVALPCLGNSRLVFVVATAFVGPLLDLVGEDGGGIHVFGRARAGKTTALAVAASVWGGPSTASASGFVRQWRATANAVEGICAAHSDTLLPIDELSQADAREVGDIAYLIANGRGKARADRSGGLRASAQWRALFLSTGEMSFADKTTEAGKQLRAGQLPSSSARSGGGSALACSAEGEGERWNCALKSTSATRCAASITCRSN